MNTSKIIEPEIIINPNSRIISVPQELYNIGVVSDDNAELVKIRIPRFFDGNDFSTRICTISYNNALKERGIYKVKEIEVTENSLLLSWNISKFVTKKSGKIHFVVEFKREVDERGLSYSWSTLPAEMNVMEGLDDNIVIDERDLSLYQSLFSHIQATDRRLADLMQQIGDISLISFNIELLNTQVSDIKSTLDLLRQTTAYLDSEFTLMEE